jgi:hypothetical protein
LPAIDTKLVRRKDHNLQVRETLKENRKVIDCRGKMNARKQTWPLQEPTTIFLSGKWRNGFIALGIQGYGTRFWSSQREILPGSESRQCGLNKNNRKNATEALARRMQQQKSAAGRMQQTNAGRVQQK